MLLAGGVLLSCAGEWITVAATDPLDKIVVSPSGEAFLHAQPGVELHELVSVEPFLEVGLRPGMTESEATTLLGETDFITTDREGRDQVYGYETSAGAFEIVKQHVSSEGTEVDRWFVRHRPTNCPAMVNPLILQQLRNLERFPGKVTLLAGRDRKGVVSIDFAEDQTCSTIWWLEQDVA